jgi:predicted Fe-Mo cluster-binding NifX family protein
MMKKEISMKIAAITEDGKTISQHFGRAPYYLVLTIEDGKIVNREMRNKMGHNQFHEQAHAKEPYGKGHGMDAQSHDKHISMSQTIADCKALLCGGMGMGAYESMRRLNIQPVVTDLGDIEAAAQAFIDGKLIDHTEFLH